MKKDTHNYLHFLYGSLILFFGIVFIFVFYQKINPEILYFKAIDSIGFAPYRAKIYYKVPSNLIDSLTIKNGTIFSYKLSEKSNYFEKTLYIPSYYYIRLCYKDSILLTSNIYVKNKKWEIYYKYQDSTYFANIKPHSGLLNLTIDTILKLGLDTNKVIETKFIYSNDINCVLDNSTIEFKIKSYYKKFPYKNFFKFTIHGQNGIFSFFLPDKKSQFIPKVTVSETNLNNNLTDLLGLYHDFSKWSVIKIETQNKKVTVYIDSKLVYTTIYSKEIRNIKSIHLYFSYSGEIDYFHIYNKEKKLVYNEEFEK